MTSSDIVAKIRAEKNSNIDTLILEASNVEISNNIGLIIPVGTTLDRDSVLDPRKGTIRYNSTYKAFEGYDGINWGTFSGVKDVSQTTFIRAETEPRKNNKQLDFITNNIQRMQIDSNGDLKFGDISDQNIIFFIDYNSGDVSAQNILPKTDNSYSLGDFTNKWKELYLDNSGIHIGKASIAINDNNVIVLNDISNMSIILEASNVNITDKLFVDDDVSFNKKLFVDGDVSFNKNLFVDDDVSFNKNLFVGGDVSFNKNLFVDNDVSFNKNLLVGGDVHFNKNLLVGDSYGVSGQLLKSNGPSNPVSWDTPVISITTSLSFSRDDKTLTKKSIRFSNPINITKNNIIAKLDNLTNYPQVYTFGKSEPSRWVAVTYDNTHNDQGSIYYSDNDGINWHPVIAKNSSPDMIFERPERNGVHLGKLWNCVAWNGSMWIALGELDPSAKNNLAYSYDGIEWIGTKIFQGNFIGNSISSNETMWVAVGEFTNISGGIVYSYDETSWHAVSSDNVNNFKGNGVAWNGSMWVAVGEFSTVFSSNTTGAIFYSYDGINWDIKAGLSTRPDVERVLPSVAPTTCSCVAWNGNIWLVWTENSLYNSVDGLVWTTANADARAEKIRVIVCNGNISLAANEDDLEGTGGGIIYSDDTNLRPDSKKSDPNLSPPYRRNLRTDDIGVCFNMTTRPNANTPLDLPKNIKTIAWNGFMWIAAGKSWGSGKKPHGPLSYSKDGLKWRYPPQANIEEVFTANTTIMGVACNRTRKNYIKFPKNRILAGVGRKGQNIFFSDWSTINGIYDGNGISKWKRGDNTWQPDNTSLATQPIPNSSIIHRIIKSIAWNGTLWVAVGSNSYDVGHVLKNTHNIIYSYTGDKWLIAKDKNSDNNVKFNNYESERQQTSSDSATPSQNANAVAWNGSIWVAVGDGENIDAIRYSYDGKIWEKSGTIDGTTTSPSSASFLTADGPGYCLAWNGTVWVAGGGTGQLLYSSNGINWNSASREVAEGNAPSANIYGVAWFNDKWVLIIGNESSDQPSILYSSLSIPFDRGPGVREWEKGKLDGTETTLTNFKGYGVAWNGTIGIAVGEPVSSGSFSIFYSYDGKNWNGVPSSNSILPIGKSIAWHYDKWLAGGVYFSDVTRTNVFPKLVYSYDGKRWHSSTEAFGGQAFGGPTPAPEDGINCIAVNTGIGICEISMNTITLNNQQELDIVNHYSDPALQDLILTITAKE